MVAKLPQLEIFLARKSVRTLVRPKRDEALAALMAGVEAELRAAFAPASQAAHGVVLAGLWLRAGDLETGHKICQDIPTELGSAWHAVMHRREGDFWNSKYWWRRAPGVPWPKWMVEGIAKVLESGEMAGTTPALQALAQRARGGAYEPSGFVDAVEAGKEAVLEEIQELEWRGLFEISRQALESKPRP